MNATLLRFSSMSEWQPGRWAERRRARGRAHATAVGPWEIALLAVVAIVAVLYVVAAAKVTQISTNDGAYYYGVARHMARTGRFEEPIVFHFMHPPPRIVHAPFDYWGCLTSLLLAPVLAVFGATLQTAFLTMSVLSAASVLVFWYLVCFALPLRYRATQLTGPGRPVSTATSAHRTAPTGRLSRRTTGLRTGLGIVRRRSCSRPGHSTPRPPSRRSR